MKLRNKKTGEIVEIPQSLKNMFVLWEEASKRTHQENNWEIFIEQKINYYISADGVIRQSFEIDNDRLLLGNSFETEEEAQKAIEKLKAWKRLKDKGVEFYGWRRNQTGTYELYLRWEDRIPRSYEVKNDLDLLFGGEE